ncbi:hypothetical protein ABH941_006391 [Streptacidiphilus sp. EB103A]|jgi:hypothetical protein
MALWLDFGKGYARVLRNLLRGLRWARDGWDGYVVPTGGAISRARLGGAPLQWLLEATAKPTVPVGHEEVFWRELRKVVVDATVCPVVARIASARAGASRLRSRRREEAGRGRR